MIRQFNAIGIFKQPIYFYNCIVQLLQLQPLHKGLDLSLGGGGGAQVLFHQRADLRLHQVVRLAELRRDGHRGSIKLGHQVAHGVRNVAQGVGVVLGVGAHAGAGGGRRLEGQLLLLGHGGRLGGRGGRGGRGRSAGGGRGGRAGHGGGHGGRGAVVQALHQAGVAKAGHLGDGVGLAGDSAVHVTLDDGDVAAADALDHRHAAAGQEGDVARLGGVIGGEVGALSAHAVDPAAVAGAGQQRVIGDVGILRREGQEGDVPGGVGSAVPSAVTGIALLLAGLDGEVLLALGIAHLGLGDGQDGLGPVGRHGRAAHGRGPIRLGLGVMLRHVQRDAGQVRGGLGVRHGDDQLVVAIGRGGPGQLRGAAGGGGGRGRDHAAVLDGLHGHRVGSHAAGDLRGNGHSRLARVDAGRRGAGADRQIFHHNCGDGAFSRLRFMIMVMNFLSEDAGGRHRKEHDQNHHHGHNTMGETDFHLSSS